MTTNAARSVPAAWTAVALFATVLAPIGGAGIATAADSVVPTENRVANLSRQSSADGSKIVDMSTTDGHAFRVQVYSAAMDRNILVEVQRSRSAGPAPTLYLLNGGGGGEDAATWRRQTDVLDYLARKSVNVVQPVGGKFSYYTDWAKTDPVLGVNKWRTFLTEELPPLVDARFRGNGVNAIAGLSMAATSVLQLATARPDLYRSVAAYSGCPHVSDRAGHSLIEMVVGAGGGDVNNMYGPADSPAWADNDPYVHADRLRGKSIFISSGSGLPGVHDNINDPHLVAPGLGALVNQVAIGGAIENVTHQCTVDFEHRLNLLGIPATFDIDENGSHSWGYWQDMFKKSWPVLAAGLGIAA